MIERLRADHAAALLAFERANRAYFAKSVPDRGDDFFAEFDARLQALLDEQATGAIHMHLLVGAGGEVLGRVNLVDIVDRAADRAADLGFRVAEHAAGRGLATTAVRDVCVLARDSYGLTSVRAAAAAANVGSRTVLRRNGFVRTGDIVLSGKPGHTFLLRLTESD